MNLLLTFSILDSKFEESGLNETETSGEEVEKPKN